MSPVHRCKLKMLQYEFRAFLKESSFEKRLKFVRQPIHRNSISVKWKYFIENNREWFAQFSYISQNSYSKVINPVSDHNTLKIWHRWRDVKTIFKMNFILNVRIFSSLQWGFNRCVTMHNKRIKISFKNSVQTLKTKSK